MISTKNSEGSGNYTSSNTRIQVGFGRNIPGTGEEIATFCMMGWGHMSVQITPEGYKDRLVMYPRIKIDSLTIDELRTDLKTYAANYVYTANCVVLEEEQVIEHHRLSHTYPYDWGVMVQQIHRRSAHKLPDECRDIESTE